MFFIALYGVLIIAVSLLMIARPKLLVRWGVRYCRKPYMHPVEIALCLGFGLPFVLYAGQSRFPAALQIFGYVLVAVGVGLMLTPPSLHRRYGVWSLERFGKYFRPLGFGSLLFGALLVWAAL